MMRFDEYRSLDGTDMASLVEKGEVSVSELLECAYSRYREVNPHINAIVTSNFSNARRYCKRRTPAGKLAGVPIVLKDLLGHFPGVPTSGGSRAYQYVMQRTPSTIVDRLCKQGALIVGKTNTPEFGLLATTDNQAFGVTRNPWDLRRIAGGSSGGTAAAVAAGIVPVGTAGDGGGSIRIPASCCGLFGLKPSRGLVPSGPEFGEVWDGAVSEHVITRSVRDSALVLDMIAGPDAVTHSRYDGNRHGFLNRLEVAPARLRIAFTRHSILGGPVSSTCQQAVEHAANLLEAQGHQVQEATPDVNGEEIIKAYSDIYIAHVTAEIDRIASTFGQRYARANVEPLSYFMSCLGRRFSAGDFVNSRLLWVKLQQTMADFHQNHDVWLTPVLADVPYPLAELRSSLMEQRLASFASISGLHRILPVSLLYQFSGEQLMKVPFTQLANLTGQPAMSVPLYWDQQNLPVGVQCVAGAGQDELLLQLARQLELAQPWFDRTPAVPVS